METFKTFQLFALMLLNLLDAMLGGLAFAFLRGF